MSQSRRKILMVASEAAPFKKVGGLADVVGALSKALARRGHAVRVVLPKYSVLDEAEALAPAARPDLEVGMGPGPERARVWEACFPGSEARCHFIGHSGHFGAPAVYRGPSGAEADNGRRFAFLVRAALDLCESLEWAPDIVHGHDWPAALAPVHLNTTDFARPAGRAASVLTIHNLQHQGRFPPDVLDYAGLPPSVFRADGLECSGQAGFLKGGLYHATKLTTVSPGYAREIQEPEGGWGLHHVLRHRSNDLYGVLNGIDTEEWAPSADPLIPARFDACDLRGKAVCKAALQTAFGLEPAPDTPVFAVVSRLYDQKGLDLLAVAGDRLMAEMRMQVAVLGTGEPALEAAFAALAARHPGRFAVHTAFDNGLAHLNYAGADFLVMPSRFEPCGLSQMYAMTYGTLPVVRATGGLADTVEPHLPGEGIGTGFRFEAPTAEALFRALGQACATYHDRPADLAALRRNAMAADFSWDRSAEIYERVYEDAVATRAGAFR